MTQNSVIRPMGDLPPGAMLPEDEGSMVTGADSEQLQADLEALDASNQDLSEGDVVEQPDGSAVVKVRTEVEKRDAAEFDANLADGIIDAAELVHMGMEFCELIAADKEARKERDKQYAEGIKRTGMSGVKVGADFDGASSVTHPMLARGCVDFASKAIKELFPSSGPVRTQIIGDQTDHKIDRAERKKTYMNWQLTEQIPEHRPEFEKMLSQLPLGGSQYKRWWYDLKMERARTMAVYIDDVFLPFDQNDFYTTPRLTHREFLGRASFEERIDSGLYMDVGGSKSGDQPDRSEADKASRDVEGVTDDSAAYDKTGGTREVYTIYADLAIIEDTESKGELAPYVLHVEEYGSKVLGVYRNWKQKDAKRQKLHWMVEYNFIPWRGAYAIGLAHLIGSMSISATGALNALLDSAHINNFPGGLKLKGGRNSGQSITVNATEIKELEAPTGVDDIRKLVMAFPFNGPSAVLYNLLEWLTQQAEMVVGTASEKIAEGGANMPMGTALALIEGGSTNFSAIHARLHHSARRELEILHRLNATYINDEETVEELGELIVYRQDFTGPMDVLPVSDPNIFSEAQRYAQLQAVMQLEAMPRFAPFFKPERLLVRALRLLQVPYAEDIANLPKDPRRMAPVDENAASALDDGTPLKVYEEQDDLDHLVSHITFLTSPLLGSNPIIGSVAVPKLLAHCKEHLIAYYRKNHKAATEAVEIAVKKAGLKVSPSQTQSMGHSFADKAMAEALAPVVGPGLQKAQQLAQQFAPKPPADGNTQATLASAQQLKQAELAAQEKIKKAELDAAAIQKDKDRENALALKKMELDFNGQQRQMDRDQQDQAAQVTAAIEKMQADTDKHISLLTLVVNDSQKKSEASLRVLLQEMKQQNDAAMLVLQAMLNQSAPAPAATVVDADTGVVAEPTAPAAAPLADITVVAQELIDSINTNAQQVSEHLAQASVDNTAVIDKLYESEANADILNNAGVPQPGNTQ